MNSAEVSCAGGNKPKPNRRHSGGTWTKLLVALFTGMALSTVAMARPLGTIDCAFQGLETKTQVQLGDALVNGDFDGPEGMIAIQKTVDQSTAVCARRFGWTPPQQAEVTGWTMAKLMADSSQRQSGLSAADATSMQAYVNENPDQVAGIDQSTPSQKAVVMAALRKRGVHLHDGGDAHDREMGLLVSLREMMTISATFTAS